MRQEVGPWGSGARQRALWAGLALLVVIAWVTAPLARADASLPDARAYEQASPVDKDAGDAVGEVALVKASPSGDGITFGSTFGMPGGKGAQAFPFFLAAREKEIWGISGLLPPATTGERARVLGWTPGFERVFTRAERLLGGSTDEAFLTQAPAGGSLTQITPYVKGAEFLYDGSSADGSVAIFEASAALPAKEGGPPLEGALQGARNVYAWDRETGEVSLASKLNTLTESKDALPNGANAGAGPDDYHEDFHAVSASGGVFFTARGPGQLYERLNPTEPQSAMSGGKCLEAEMACTIHISASEKTNGKGGDGHDAAGPLPAVFQAASKDGAKAIFSSAEKLTDDANTGPEQPLAAISRATIDGKAVETEFLPTHAIGVTVDGSHIYWIDPAKRTIGRANLEGKEANDEFIVPGPVNFKEEVEPGVFKEEDIESEPRYLAVDSEYVYWTNTGRTKDFKKGKAIDGGGTIGRARLDLSEPPDPDCIRGASKPQGIAVSSEFIYWANAGESNATKSIGRAKLDCTQANQAFIPIELSAITPHGLALSPTHIYFSVDENTINGFIWRLPLNGNEAERAFVFISSETPHLRGLAIDSEHLYWASQKEERIGRIPLADFPKLGPCENVPTCEKEFIKTQGAPVGLAADAAHLYWSVNGEAPSNPGNDLYLYDSGAPEGERLTDLSVDGAALDGAEVQGVLGASGDLSHVYYAANGPDLAAGGEAGTCKGPIASASGKCNLYEWDEGLSTHLASLDANGGDQLTWLRTPRNLLFSNTYTAKTAFITPDGEALLFRSKEKLTDYDNKGTLELYLHRDGAETVCVSCNPEGEAPSSTPSLGSVTYPRTSPPPNFISLVSSRNLSSSGERAFFETTEALSPEDTNGEGEKGCEPSGSNTQSYPDCLDVYEWEAPGEGSCTEASPEYSAVNQGCLFLISTGKSAFPSLFADASLSGKDVFFFTRDQLVGQDKDVLQDVYDARVGGGLASQDPQPPVICESIEACHPEGPQPPEGAAPTTQLFQGPADPAPKRKAVKPKKHHRHHHHHRKKHGGKKGRAGR